MSWSDYITNVLEQVNKSEKNTIHNSTKSIYTMFEKGYSVEDVVVYIRGARI